MAMILNHLRTSPPPRIDPRFAAHAASVLPPPSVSSGSASGTPAAAISPAQLPLDPVQYLTLAIDAAAPLVRVRGLKKLGGGGRNLDVPVPLRERQRRRTAVVWILDAVAKKPSRGSGRRMFAVRFAEEVIAVAEGRSSVWQKRAALHKLATACRANLSAPQLGKRRLR